MDFSQFVASPEYRNLEESKKPVAIQRFFDAAAQQHPAEAEKLMNEGASLALIQQYRTQAKFGAEAFRGDYEKLARLEAARLDNVVQFEAGAIDQEQALNNDVANTMQAIQTRNKVFVDTGSDRKKLAELYILSGQSDFIDKEALNNKDKKLTEYKELLATLKDKGVSEDDVLKDVSAATGNFEGNFTTDSLGEIVAKPTVFYNDRETIENLVNSSDLNKFAKEQFLDTIDARREAFAKAQLDALDGAVFRIAQSRVGLGLMTQEEYRELLDNGKARGAMDGKTDVEKLDNYVKLVRNTSTGTAASNIAGNVSELNKASNAAISALVAFNPMRLVSEDANRANDDIQKVNLEARQGFDTIIAFNESILNLNDSTFYKGAKLVAGTTPSLALMLATGGTTGGAFRAGAARLGAGRVGQRVAFSFGAAAPGTLLSFNDTLVQAQNHPDEKIRERATEIAFTGAAIEQTITTAFGSIPGFEGIEASLKKPISSVIAKGGGKEAVKKLYSGAVSRMNAAGGVVTKNAIGEIAEESTIQLFNAHLVQAELNPNLTVGEFIQSMQDTALVSGVLGSAFASRGQIQATKDFRAQQRAAAKDVPDVGDSDADVANSADKAMQDLRGGEDTRAAQLQEVDREITTLENSGDLTPEQESRLEQLYSQADTLRKGGTLNSEESPDGSGPTPDEIEVIEQGQDPVTEGETSDGFTRIRGDEPQAGTREDIAAIDQQIAELKKVGTEEAETDIAGLEAQKQRIIDTLPPEADRSRPPQSAEARRTRANRLVNPVNDGATPQEAAQIENEIEQQKLRRQDLLEGDEAAIDGFEGVVIDDEGRPALQLNDGSILELSDDQMDRLTTKPRGNAVRKLEISSDGDIAINNQKGFKYKSSVIGENGNLTSVIVEDADGNSRTVEGDDAIDIALSARTQSENVRSIPQARRVNPVTEGEGRPVRKFGNDAYRRITDALTVAERLVADPDPNIEQVGQTDTVSSESLLNARQQVADTIADVRRKGRERGIDNTEEVAEKMYSVYEALNQEIQSRQEDARIRAHEGFIDPTDIDAVVEGNIDADSPKVAEVLTKVDDALNNAESKPAEVQEQALRDYANVASVAGVVPKSDPTVIVPDVETGSVNIEEAAQNALQQIREVFEFIGKDRAKALFDELKSARAAGDVDAIRGLEDKIDDAYVDAKAESEGSIRSLRFGEAGAGIQVFGTGGLQFFGDGRRKNGVMNAPVVAEAINAAFEIGRSLVSFGKELLGRLGSSAINKVRSFFEMAKRKDGPVTEEDLTENSIDDTVISEQETDLDAEAEEAAFRNALDGGDTIGVSRIENIPVPDSVVPMVSREGGKAIGSLKSSTLKAVDIVKDVFNFTVGTEFTSSQIQEDLDFAPNVALASFATATTTVEPARNFMMNKLQQLFGDTVVTKTDDKGNHILQDVVPKEDTFQSLYFSDVISTMQKDIADNGEITSYTVKDKAGWENFVREYTKVTDYIVKITGEEGVILPHHQNEDGTSVDISKVNEDFHGVRGRVTHRDLIDSKVKGPISSSRLKSTGSKGQVFNSELEGVDKGYIYPDHPFARMADMYAKAQTVVYTQRLFNDSDFRSVAKRFRPRPGEIVEQVDPISGDIKVTEKKSTRKDRQLLEGVVELGPLKMKTDVENARQIQRTIDKVTENNPFLNSMADAMTAPSKALLTGDMSFMFNQGLYAFFTRPVAWGKAASTAATNMFNNKKQLMAEIENRSDMLKLYTQHGGRFGVAADEFRTSAETNPALQRERRGLAGIAQKVKRPFDKITGKFGEAQGLFQTLTASYIFEAEVTRLKAEGADTPANLAKAAKAADNIIGREDLARYGVSSNKLSVARGVTTAIGMYAGLTGAMLDMFSSDSRVRNTALKRMGLFGAAINTSYFILAMSAELLAGEEDDETTLAQKAKKVGSRMIPGNPDFMMIDVNVGNGTKRLAWGGFYRGLINTMGRAVRDPFNADEHVGRFLSGKLRNSIHMTQQLIEGEDFFGRPATTVEVLRSNLTPLPAQPLVERASDPVLNVLHQKTGIDLVTLDRIAEKKPDWKLTTFDFLTGFVGINGYVEDEAKQFQRQLNRESKSEFGKFYDDLTMEEARSVRTAVNARGAKKPKFKGDLQSIMENNEKRFRGRFGRIRANNLDDSTVESLSQLIPYSVVMQPKEEATRIPKKLRESMEDEAALKFGELYDSGLRGGELVKAAKHEANRIRQENGLPTVKVRD